MKKYLRHIIISISILLAVIVVIYSLIYKVPVPKSQGIDLSSHPIYSKYKFEDSDNVINIGIQPINIPTGIVTEAMERDKILEQSINRLGLKLRFYPFLKGADVNLFVKKGILDVGHCGDMPTIAMASQSDIVITSMTEIGYTSIVAKQPILMSELKGKVIGYAFGSDAHYALMATLAQEGLSESDVKLVQMETTQMPEALKDNKIYAFSAWEPTPICTVRNNPDTMIIHKTISTQYLYFSKRLYEQKRDAVYQIIASEIRAVKWLLQSRQNRFKANSWVIKSVNNLYPNQSLNLSEDILEELGLKTLLNLTSTSFIPDNMIMHDGPLYKEFVFLKKIGKLPNNADWNKVYKSFTNSALSEVLGNPEKYAVNEFNYDTK